MDIALDAALMRLAMPDRAGGRTEEHPAHIVVDADDIEALAGEEADRLAADQPRRARDDCYAHGFILPRRSAPARRDCPPAICICRPASHSKSAPAATRLQRLFACCR